MTSTRREFSVLLINPNTSRWVTDKLADHLGALLSPARGGLEVRIEALTARFGAPYIASQETFDTGALAVLDAWSRHLAQPRVKDSHRPLAHGRARDLPPSDLPVDPPGDPPGDLPGLPDAVLIGCFGDPGLQALRAAAAPVPVLGLAQAAVGEAHGAGRFAIVTGGRAWKPMLERLVASFGWQDRLDNVTVIDQSGADLAADPEAALQLLGAACRQAAVPGVQRVVLGGAGFAGYGDALAEQVPVPVIDSVSAAGRALQALAEYSLQPTTFRR